MPKLRPSYPRFSHVADKVLWGTQLQGSGLGPAAPQDRSAAGAGMPDPSQMDPAAAQEAMASMFQNPDFMNMAQSLGQKIMEVRKP